MGLIQTPRLFYGKFEELIKRVHYRQFEKELGEDPLKFYKRELIQEHNKELLGVNTQGSDGSVPSFEKYTAIKDRIKRDKSHPTGATPLVVEERQESAMQEFIKLEEMIEAFGQKKATRAKIRNLQA